MVIGVCLMATGLLCLVACRSNVQKGTAEEPKIAYETPKNLVDTMVLRKREFFREIISNGVIHSVRKVDLRFAAGGIVKSVNCKNGEYVKKGALLASLESSEQEVNYRNAIQSWEKATLDLLDYLISNGYSSDTSQVPSESLRIAKLRTGYNSAYMTEERARVAIEKTRLKAPFAGRIANLHLQQYGASADPALTLIDDSAFNVCFSILESEIPFVTRGTKIKISPYIELSKSYHGEIYEINPVVDTKGQVEIVARISNPGRDLMDGMNVKIYIESARSEQLIVPKSAVVMRDGYDVVFLYDADAGKARWLYVDILHSNSTHHVISGCKRKRTEVTEGMIVITDGNLNLADGTDVTVR